MKDSLAPQPVALPAKFSPEIFAGDGVYLLRNRAKYGIIIYVCFYTQIYTNFREENFTWKN